MRVLQVHTRYRQAGGEDAVVATEQQLLVDAGHEVRLWQAANPTSATAAASLASGPWNPAAARRIREAARAFGPDVAHIHNTWFAASPSVVSSLRRLGIPVVMTLHNYRLLCPAATLYRDGAPCHDCVGVDPWPGVRHRCYRGSTAQSAIAAGTVAIHRRRGTWQHEVDAFLALSEFGKERFCEGGLPRRKVLVKPNSVADPGPRPRPPSASNEILFIGRLTPEKGIEHLLAAWSRLETDLQLTVIGTGPLAEQLRSAVVARNVTFLGQCPHEAVTARLRSARGLVFPSTWYEGHPLVAIEAAAAGLPVILSDLGAMTELFSPEAEALLFRPGDQAALAERLERLTDDGFVDHYGALTRRRFLERYTHELALRRLGATYRRVIEG